MSNKGFRVEPGTHVDLAKFDPAYHGGLTEQSCLERLTKAKAKLEELQELLYAAGSHSALIVLQGLDTAGKDGTIRMLSTCMNVQHTLVSSFKQPTTEELSHDFLWRIHRAAPAKGNIAIFNRSHYEDVLVVRVHDLVPKPVWKERYEQINQFETLLNQQNTIILKFFLHISHDEQSRRLQAREVDQNKSWKLSVADLKERKLWDDYTKAYEAALSKCSKEKAPWIVIPSDHKWYRNLCVVEALVAALEPYQKGWKKDLIKRGEIAESAIKAYRESQSG